MAAHVERRLLSRILGKFRVAQDAQRDLLEASVHMLGEDSEGCLVSVLRPNDQVLVHRPPLHAPRSAALLRGMTREVTFRVPSISRASEG